MPELPSTPRIRTLKGAWSAGAIPLLVFTVIAVFLGIGLTLNPREVPSPLIGRAVPAFSLPPVLGRTAGLSDGDLKGEVSVVNVFASWCVPCRDEHPVIQKLAAEVPVHGLNHKDRPQDAARWLNELGDPYTRTGADLDGRVSIDWGVYGVPETFVVDREGRVVYKHIGPISPRSLEEKLLPLIRKLQREKSATGGSGNE
jgi:cytochrome c biogenesis protein CcmG/thiol:disulfide interchange protein DsbE